MATRYNLGSIPDGTIDSWDGVFKIATHDREEDSTDMVPYWIFPMEGGAKIERYVPALPLSSDRNRMEMLRKALAAYRMVFGQTRQEDLLSYPLSRFTTEKSLSTPIPSE